MSGVDPLAAAAAGNADLAALVDAELAQLAADAQALRALLVEDAVLTARVLPSNGLTDLLEIAGRRVAASLPPTVRPGDVLQVRVTGFDGDRTLLQIVATGADAAVEPGPPNAPLAPQPGAFVPATIQRAPGAAPLVPGSGPVQLPPSAAQAAAFGDTTTAGGTTVLGASPGASTSTSAAPGAVVPGPGVPAGPADDADLPPPAAPAARPGGGGGLGSVASRANVTAAQAGENVAGASPGGVLRGAVAPGEPTSIEARLAAARAADSPAVPGARVPPASLNAGPALRGFVAPPAIEAKPLAAAAPSAAAGAAAGEVAAAQTMAARASALAAYAEPVALLRTLRLPVTPSNVSSAALALQRPERLPDALAALERALPRASDDPNVATLRTLLAFVGRIDPRSPVLAAQIAAYVEHVVDGAEPKLATLLAASQAASVPSDSASNQPGAARAAGAQSIAGADTSAQRASSPAAPAEVQRPIAAGVAAERGAALSADLKQTMLAVAANPATPESAAPSLAAAITALTAVQLTAAQTLASQPDGLAFTIPLATAHGTANAQITVKRDAPDSRSGARLDPANFRIAFVLETAHYGTVAIDLVTVGRDVTVDVRTEAAPAMRAFRNALGALTARLESLRYRVASAGASVGTTSTVALDAPPSRPADPDATVDRSA
jgi:hypothetical protein